MSDPVVAVSRLSGLSGRVVQLSRSRLSGLAATATSDVVRVEIDGSGPAATQGVFPGETVIVTAAANFPVTAWSWSSNYPGLGIVATQQAATYIAPGTLEGVTLTITVSASGAGGQQASDTVTHIIRAHAGAWRYTAARVLVPVLEP